MTRGIADELKNDTTEVLSGDEILALDVDVLVFAALGDVLEDSNQSVVKASILLELANGPIDSSAHD